MQVRVPFRLDDAFVTSPLLDHAQIDSPLDQPRQTGVSERVRDKFGVFVKAHDFSYPLPLVMVTVVCQSREERAVLVSLHALGKNGLDPLRHGNCSRMRILCLPGSQDASL